MRNVFEFRDQLIAEYASFSRSFTRFRAQDIARAVEAEYKKGRFWPEPLIQINPNYQRAKNVDELVAEGVLHPVCAQLFRFGPNHPLRLFQHQQEALSKASAAESYVVTTGTGSGKSLAFFVPIFDRILREKAADPTPRTRAIIIYPMNALANSQLEEVRKFLDNFGSSPSQITVERYTGQEDTATRERIAANPPDILLTNFMMLELILTRYEKVDRQVVEHCAGLRFLVLDELHTYRGRQGADVALLVRRLRERFKAEKLICVGTSATMSSTGSNADKKKVVAEVATKLFGQLIPPENVIGETLERATNPHLSLQAVRPKLSASLARTEFAWPTLEAFANDPLAVWVELTLGLTLSENGRPERAKPISLSDAAELLALAAGVEPKVAQDALARFLLAAQDVKTPAGTSLFAFKLHQFISGAGKVLCTLEPPAKRVITLDSQRFAPNRQSQQVFLYGTHFCRDCGQEYHPVWHAGNSSPHFTPREIDDTGSDESSELRPGFLAPRHPEQEFQGEITQYPDAWLDTSREEPVLNPMALELARTALWLEGFEPGQPLSFLDHHLVCGDALLGLTDFAILTKGIPADAFAPLAGDSKSIAKALAADNRAALKELEKRASGPELFAQTDTADLLAELRALEALPETNPLEVECKAAAYTTFLGHARDSGLAQAADLVVAAFLAPKATEADRARCPTTQTLADLLYPRQGSAVSPATLAYARDLCREARVHHWPLAFAAIFARGGFDCVLGNPPWDMLQLDPQEYFATRAPHVANAQNMAARDKEIAALKEANDPLYQDYSLALRITEATQAFVHAAPRFRYSGNGRINLASLFTETCLNLISKTGKAGIVSPSGVATDSFTQHLWNHIADGRLTSLYDFENREKIFPAVDSRMKFCLLTMGASLEPEFACFLSRTSQILDRRRRFTLTGEDFKLINPNTRTCPIFRSNADAELTKRIYRRWPVLWKEATDDSPEENPWKLELQLMFMMNTDSGIFLNQPAPGALPLYEAKMMHQFDHRWSTYRWNAGAGEVETDDVSDAQKADPTFTVQPRYWVDERHVLARLADAPRCVTRAYSEGGDILTALATWVEAGHQADLLAEMGGATASTRARIIAAAGQHFKALPPATAEWLKDKDLAEAANHSPLTTDERVVLSTALSLADATRTLLDARSPRWLMGWRDITNATNERTVIASIIPRAAAGNKIPLFSSPQPARQCAALLSNLCSLVLDYVARQKMGGTTLNFFIAKQFPILPPSAYTEADLAYIVPRVLELTYTSHDLAPWAADLGHIGAPFGFNPERRAVLRAELDAYYARLYGLTRDELRYILDPADTHGAEYPSETFRGLKSNDIKAHGDYRTRRLVLGAWDKLQN